MCVFVLFFHSSHNIKRKFDDDENEKWKKKNTRSIKCALCVFSAIVWHGTFTQTAGFHYKSIWTKLSLRSPLKSLIITNLFEEKKETKNNNNIELRILWFHWQIWLFCSFCYLFVCLFVSFRSVYIWYSIAKLSECLQVSFCFGLSKNDGSSVFG